MHKRIRIFSAEGDFLGQQTCMGGPNDITRGRDGNFYIAELRRWAPVFVGLVRKRQVVSVDPRRQAWPISLGAHDLSPRFGRGTRFGRGKRGRLLLDRCPVAPLIDWRTCIYRKTFPCWNTNRANRAKRQNHCRQAAIGG